MDTYPEESADNGPRIVILWDLLKVNIFAVITNVSLFFWKLFLPFFLYFMASKLELNNANYRFYIIETIKTFRTH